MDLKRILGSIALSSVVVLSCASASLAVTKVEWWHAMGGTLNDNVNKIAKDFNASQSEYEIVPVYKGNYTETMTAAIAAFRAHKQPAIVQVFEVGTASMMAAKGAIYPVEKMMTDMGEPFDRSSFLPAVYSYYQSDKGDLLSMPFNSSTPVLYYNKDAFKKAGIAEPPKTWDDVEADSIKLKAAGYQCGISFGWQSWLMVENFSAWHNIAMGTEDDGYGGMDTRLQLGNKDQVKMLDKLASMAKRGLFEYGGRRDDSKPLFLNQKCGMWMNSSGSYGGLKSAAKFDFGQTMMPFNSEIADAPQNSIIGGATLWVLQGHDKAVYKGVAKFFTYLSSPKVQAWWHQTTGYVPITTAAYELSKQQGYYEKNPGTDTGIKELSLNTPTANSRGIRFGNYVQIRDIINEELENIWNGSKTAQQAMDDASSRGNALLEKFQKANQ